MTSYRPTLVLDFDGVLNSYTSGWQGADVCTDPPVPNMVEFLREAVQVFNVCVLSSRSHEPGGSDCMALWMVKYLPGSAYVAGDPHADPQPAVLFMGHTIHFPLHKPPAHVTLDDRAVQFNGIWPDVSTLLAFKPWNK